MGVPWQKPLRGAQINPAHPLARGLTCCVLLNEQTGRLYWDSRQRKLLSGDSGGYPTWQGDALAFDNINERVVIGGEKSLTTDGIMTVAYSMAFDIDNFLYTIGNTVTSFWVGVAKYYTGTSVRLYCMTSRSSATPISFTAPRINDGGFHTYVAQWAGPAGAKLWEDGIYLTPSNSSAAYAYLDTVNGSVAQLVFGSTDYQQARGRMRWVMAWNRVLTPGEMQMLNANPYCMFRQPTDIGAFEFVDEGGTLSIPVAMHHYNLLRSA